MLCLRQLSMPPHKDVNGGGGTVVGRVPVHGTCHSHVVAWLLDRLENGGALTRQRFDRPAAAEWGWGL